ncbi:hypothetical protein GCM10023339_74330 [Alloalcanivorax gelatiniphagus]
MNLSNKLKRTKKVIPHPQNVSKEFRPQNQGGDCQLNGRQIFFTRLLIRKLFQLLHALKLLSTIHIVA